jgi:hypothetical protein
MPWPRGPSVDERQGGPMRKVLRQGRSVALALPLYSLLLGLGLISLGWNLAAMLLQPLLPPHIARPLGRRVIAGAYRAFWTLASLTGMMRIDARCLDALRDEPGG